MTRMRRMGALLLVLAMMLSAVPMVMAAPEYDPSESVSLTLYKYLDNPTGNLSDDDEYNGVQQTPDGTYTPVPDVTFKITLVEYSGSGNYTDPDNWTAVSGPGAVELTNTTGSDGKVVFDDSHSDLSGTLPHGTYLVQETAYPSYITSPSADFLVSLPMTNHEGTAYIYDVVAYPKNTAGSEEVEIDKTYIDADNRGDNSVTTGDISWLITSSVPKTIESMTEAKVKADPAEHKYEMTDTLDSRLTYKSLSIAYGTSAPGTALTYNADPAQSDYVITNTAANGSNPETVVITLTWSGIVKLQTAVKALDPNSSDSVSLYTTMVTTVSVEDESDIGAIVNKVELDYADEITVDDDEDDDKVYTGGIKIEKYDGSKTSSDQGYNLAGAKFVLMNEDDKYYALDGDGNVVWVDDLENTNPIPDAHVVTTNSDGEAYFWGLQDGDYKLVEVEAPTGFNLLREPVEVEVEGNIATGVYLATEEVANYSGFELPRTGGTGTLLFTVLGLSLMTAAGIVLYIYYRKKKNS